MKFPVTPSKMLPETLGQIIHLMRCLDENPEGDPYDFLLRKPLPALLDGVLHVEYRVDGPRIAERDHLLFGARSLSKVDRVQASFLLQQFEGAFPEEVRWIREARQ